VTIDYDVHRHSDGSLVLVEGIEVRLGKRLSPDAVTALSNVKNWETSCRDTSPSKHWSCTRPQHHRGHHMSIGASTTVYAIWGEVVAWSVVEDSE
jgi:hypothetical protein